MQVLQYWEVVDAIKERTAPFITDGGTDTGRGPQDILQTLTLPAAQLV